MDTPAQQLVKAGFPVPRHSGGIQVVEYFELPRVPTMTAVFPSTGWDYACAHHHTQLFHVESEA